MMYLSYLFDSILSAILSAIKDPKNAISTSARSSRSSYRIQTITEGETGQFRLPVIVSLDLTLPISKIRQESA